MKSKEEKQYGWATVIVKFLNFIIDMMNRAAKRKKEQEIAAAKGELQKALAEGRITDAAYWKKKIDQLVGVASILLMAFLLSGCCGVFCTQKSEPIVVVPQFVIIGERINKVKPGDTITVPVLKAPAKQWYLVDDTGLYQWLDIDLSGQNKKVVK
jgi:hypothetical protein